MYQARCFALQWFLIMCKWILEPGSLCLINAIQLDPLDTHMSLRWCDCKFPHCKTNIWLNQLFGLARIVAHIFWLISMKSVFVVDDYDDPRVIGRYPFLLVWVNQWTVHSPHTIVQYATKVQIIAQIFSIEVIHTYQGTWWKWGLDKWGKNPWESIKEITWGSRLWNWLPNLVPHLLYAPSKFAETMSSVGIRLKCLLHTTTMEAMEIMKLFHRVHLYFQF